MSDDTPLTTSEVNWDIRVKALEEKKGYKICGAKNRELNPCTNKAGKGTDHVGSGRCKNHGGGSQNITAKNFKHGLYSKIKTTHPTLRQKMEELSTSYDVFDLREEILKLRAIIEMMAEQEDWDRVGKFAMDVTKAVERLHNIEVSRRLVISIDNVAIITEGIKAAILRHVPDEYQRHLISEELGNIRISMSLPKPKEEIIDAEYREIKDAGSTESN